MGHVETRNGQNSPETDTRMSDQAVIAAVKNNDELALGRFRQEFASLPPSGQLYQAERLSRLAAEDRDKIGQAANDPARLDGIYVNGIYSSKDGESKLVDLKIANVKFEKDDPAESYKPRKGLSVIQHDLYTPPEGVHVDEALALKREAQPWIEAQNYMTQKFIDEKAGKGVFSSIFSQEEKRPRDKAHSEVTNYLMEAKLDDSTRDQVMQQLSLSMTEHLTLTPGSDGDRTLQYTAYSNDFIVSAAQANLDMSKLPLQLQKEVEDVKANRLEQVKKHFGK